MNNDFSSAISEIMPLVNDGDKSTPFIITQDKDHGGWQVCYPYPADKAESFLASRRECDYLAVMFTGADFAKGSFSYVYDKILYARLRDEYYLARSSGLDTDELHAMCCFMQDYIGEFSHKVTDYLTTLDRPLAALVDMCPYGLTTDNPNRTYNEDFAFGAIYYIENGVNNRLGSHPDEAELNKQTQRDIQAAIESGEIGGDTKRVIEGYTENLSITLAGREVFLAVDEKRDDPYLVCTARWDNPLGATVYTDGAVTADYLEAMREFIDRVDTLLVGLEKERAAFPARRPTLTAADCIKGGLDTDLADKVVVIKPNVLSHEYRTAEYQLKIVQGGFGTHPNVHGNAVFCKDLYSDKETRYERYDIAGVIDPAKLPQWAKDKLALRESLKEPGVFTFGNFHFKPYRKFEKRDGDFAAQTRRLATDKDVGISTHEWSKTEYSHEKFYAASGGSEADIFKCVENGNLYLPCENELFRYKEPPVKTREAPKQQETKAKGTLLGEVREAGEIAKRRETERGNAAVPKKMHKNEQNEH